MVKVYRGMTIIPRKAFKGYDCKVYNGLLIPRDGKKKGFKPRRMRDIWVESINDIEDKIDEIFFDGDSKDQTKLEDFR